MTARWRTRSPGGGGYGNALDRDPAAVLRDVQDGFVTAEGARTDYGVVLQGDAVDTAVTQALRARQSRSEPVDFEFGAARDAYQVALPEAFQDHIVRLLESEPAGSRLYLRDIIYSHAREHGLDGLDDAGLRQILTDLAHDSRRPLLGRARTRAGRS